jgi:hypothetical protein
MPTNPHVPQGPIARIAETPPIRHISCSMTSISSRFQRVTKGAALILFLPALGFFLGGCATQTFAPEVAPEYVVIRDFSPFYRMGPQQARGPDASLSTGTRVKLLRREMGFSLFQLEDLRTGYVANENMAVAPPRPPEQVKQEAEAASLKKRGGRSRGDNGPIYSGPQVNDTPLPDPNVPPPDLNVEPEIVPKNIPAPDATPASRPKYRY